LLNYGYTVLRAATARAIVAAGLHPGLGLQHRNVFNSAALADDLMEPFRPIVDACVRGLTLHGLSEPVAAAKRLLVLCLYRTATSEAGASPIVTSIERLAVSLAQLVEGERSTIELPGELSPEALRSLSDGRTLRGASEEE
jgi:CRISPR-associated protein Cas1